MRKYCQRRLPSDTSKDYYFIHRNTGVTEPIIVEYGFIDDTPENVRFLEDNYKRLAEAVIRAVASYKGINYVAPPDLMTNTYTVKKGDSLYAIANKYNTTVDELKRLNNLTSNVLQIGQVLKINSNKEDSDNESPDTNNSTYTVQSGDSLYSIARKFNTTVDELKTLNNLTSNLLSINQVLKIPSTNNIPTTYTVQSGDNLYSIARKFNTTVDALKTLNNLTSNLLSVGQKLVIR